MNQDESYEHVITDDIENPIRYTEIILNPQFKCHHYVELGFFLCMIGMLILIIFILLFNWFMCLTCPSGCLNLV